VSKSIAYKKTFFKQTKMTFVRDSSFRFASFGMTARIRDWGKRKKRRRREMLTYYSISVRRRRFFRPFFSGAVLSFRA
jgi:hypothetical protein